MRASDRRSTAPAPGRRRTCAPSAARSREGPARSSATSSRSASSACPVADPVREPVAVYRSTRERLGDFVCGLDVDATRTAVPACPGWSVQDVVSHVVGIVADLQEDRLDGVGTDEWTLAQVTSRRELPIADVVAEWNRRAPAFEEQVATLPASVATQLVSDAAMHELDIRAAVGDRGARDSDGVAIALDYYGH